jgi:hypothetical protein
MIKEALIDIGLKKLAKEIKPIEKIDNKIPDLKFDSKNDKVKVKSYKKGVKNELQKPKQRSSSNLFSKSGGGNSGKSFGGNNS